MKRLKDKYLSDVVPTLREEFGYDNAFAVPTIEKVVLNMGLGEAVQNSKAIESAVEELTLISGQKPVVTRAKKSIANFKLREGVPIGCMVTLRGQRMWEFLERLFYIALPRVRDFRGLSPKAIDGRGNYTIGVREQIIFPEIDYDKVDKVRGMNITIVTTAETDEEGLKLLDDIGLPLRH